MREEQVDQNLNSHNHKLLWVLVGLLAVALGGLSYYTYQLQSKNASLQKENTSLKAESAANTKKTKTVAVVNFKNPEESIKAYVGQAENIKLKRFEGEFSEYTYSFGSGVPGGAMIIVKKSGDYWFPVFNGQESPSKALGEQLGLPKGWYATGY